MVSTETVSVKHMDFINHWLLNGHNATQAYKSAYPGCKSSAKENACVLLTKPNIKAEIERRQAKTVEKYELEADKIILRLSKISGLTPAETTDNILSTTSGDQIKSLDLLGKHLRLWDRAGEADITEQQVLDAAKSIQAKKIAEQLVLNANQRKCIISKEIDNV